MVNLTSETIPADVAVALRNVERQCTSNTPESHQAEKSAYERLTAYMRGDKCLSPVASPTDLA